MRQITLPELLSNCPKDDLGKIFIEDKNILLSFGEVQNRVQALAAILQQHGFKAGDFALIYMEKRWEAIVAILAVSWLGGIFVPVNHLFRTKHIKHILSDINANFVFLSKKTLKQMDLADRSLLTLFSQNSCIMVDELDDPSIFKQFETLKSDLTEKITIDIEHPERQISQDIAAILYTSGTTGLPKGILIPHHVFVDGAEIVSNYLKITAADRILSILPLSFDYGINQVISALFVRCTIILSDYILPSFLFKQLIEHKITGIAGTPMIWISFTRYLMDKNITRDKMPKLNYLTNSGGAIPERYVHFLNRITGDARLYLMYGLTEAFRSTYLDPAEVGNRPTSIGKAIPGVDIFLVDGNGKPCEGNGPGELVHRGKLVTQGYLNQPEKASKRFRPNPKGNGFSNIKETVVFSGDIVRKDDEGFFYFVNRIDGQIKHRSYRISPEEIESVVNSISGVSISALYGETREHETQLILNIVPDKVVDIEDGDLAKRIKKKIAQELPQYMIPARIETVKDLPVNINGKLDRSALLKRILMKPEA